MNEPKIGEIWVFDSPVFDGRAWVIRDVLSNIDHYYAVATDGSTSCQFSWRKHEGKGRRIDNLCPSCESREIEASDYLCLACRTGIE